MIFLPTQHRTEEKCNKKNNKIQPFFLTKKYYRHIMGGSEGVDRNIAQHTKKMR